VRGGKAQSSRLFSRCTPLHVESVAWAAERKDTLSTFFGLLSLLAYARYVETPLRKRYAWLTPIVSYAKYLFRTVWPSDLAVYYPFSRTGVPMWEVVCAIALLTVITTLVLRQASERPYLLVGWLWFVGTLVPVIGLA
jgi:hypothetical protein